MLKWKITMEVEDTDTGDHVKNERTGTHNNEPGKASAFWCIGMDIAHCVVATSGDVPGGHYNDLPEAIMCRLEEDNEVWKGEDAK